MPFIFTESDFMKDFKEPPKAKKVSHIHREHGLERQDPYHWLSNKEDSEVLTYLKKENVYTDLLTAHNEELRSVLFSEMLSRIKESDLSVPVKEENYFYYSRQEEGKSYSIHCRKKGNLNNPEEILLDENELAKGLDYFHLGDFEVNDEHNFIAYSIDTSGSEKFNISVKNLQTGEILENIIKDSSGNLFWGKNQNCLFYSCLDETMRPFQLWKHNIDSSQEADILIFQEEDPAFYIYADKTKSKEFYFILIASKVSSEVWFMDPEQEEKGFQLFVARKASVEYIVDHQGAYFYILSNENAPNFKLLRTLTTKPDKSNWEEILPNNPDHKLDEIEVFQDYLVILGRKNGLNSVDVFESKTEQFHALSFPEEIYSCWENENPEYKSTKFRFTYSSLVSPRAVYDYEMKSQSLELLKEYEVLGNYDRSQYQMERIFVTATDGAKIPVSLLYKKGLIKDGNNPCYLYAYGAYGECMDPYFSSTRFSLIDRGFIYAIAHVRGGGEMGRNWYENGKFLHKKNSFNDFIDCAEYMIENNFTNTKKLAISGGSAGGLLMGAVINLRPDLFQAVVADVPFVDVISTMMNEQLPLTVIEYDEWGNPNDEVFYKYMLSYSPYDNVKAQDYPNMLITAGLNDPRVQYWEPAKWTARLRALKTDNNTLLLKTNMDTGHGGKTGRYGMLEEIAFEFAFLIDHLL